MLELGANCASNKKRVLHLLFGGHGVDVLRAVMLILSLRLPSELFMSERIAL